MSSFFILISITLFAQSPPPKVVHHGHDAPDTVVIEKIRIQKKKIYIHKTDTVTKVDTLIVEKVDTLVIRDTINASNKSKNKGQNNSNKLSFKLGPYLGFSNHFSHTHFFASKQEYFESEREAVSELFNIHYGVQSNISYKNFFLEKQFGLTQLRERIEYLEVDNVNKISYLTLDMRPGCQFKLSEKTDLQLAVGAGVQILVSQNGYYINEENVDEIREDNSLYPTTKTLFSVSGRSSILYSLSPQIDLTGSMFYKYHPNSTTVIEHSVLYWRSFYGLQVGGFYTFSKKDKSKEVLPILPVDDF